jgi:hypothetical protein
MGTLDTLGSKILYFLKMMGTCSLAVFVGLGDLEKLFFTLVRCLGRCLSTIESLRIADF